MESNHKSGDGLTGTQKEAALRALIQRTGYNLIQVGIHGPILLCSAQLHPEASLGAWAVNPCSSITPCLFLFTLFLSHIPAGHHYIIFHKAGSYSSRNSLLGGKSQKRWGRTTLNVGKGGDWCLKTKENPQSKVSEEGWGGKSSTSPFVQILAQVHGRQVPHLLQVCS